MIIDCHGHFTTAPTAVSDWRRDQLAAALAGRDEPRLPSIGDSELREAIEANQLRLLSERGADLTLFSPRASAMGHHEGGLEAATSWARFSNDLIARVVDLFPRHFAGVCQLPQAEGRTLGPAVAELRRAVDELGFVGANLNPDPSGGHWTSPPLTDEYWFPLYDVLCELDVPVMVHVSASDNPAFHATGAHYLNADTTAFMQLLQGDLFARYPTLRVVIPHGGGAVPYHWGRFRGLADMLGRAPLEEHLMRNVFFDSCVYHQPGVDLLMSVVGTGNVLFGSEMVGAVRGVDPRTGHHYDDTKRYVDATGLTPEQQRAVYEQNARRVYPRLDQRLLEQGR